MTLRNYICVITDTKYFTTQFVNKESLLVSIVEFGIQMFSLHVLHGHTMPVMHAQDLFKFYHPLQTGTGV